MKRILILRLDGLGDTLLTLPLLDGLKTCWPDCEITFLASPANASVFASDKRLDHLWLYKLSAMSLNEKIVLGQRIRAANFTMVFCLNEKFWPALWTYMSNAPICVGFNPGCTQPLKSLMGRLAFSLRLPYPSAPARLSIHEVQRYAALAALAGCNASAGPIKLSLPAEAQAWAASAIASLDLAPDCVPVCMHLSAKWSTEGWGDQTCLEVARSLLDRFPNVFLIVTAGPGEELFFASAAEVLPTGRFHLFTGLDVLKWAALQAKCRALLSIDTGAVHLGAAVAVPVVAVFPQLYFEHVSSRWSPWQVPHRLIRRPAPANNGQFYEELCSALEDLLL